LNRPQHTSVQLQGKQTTKATSLRPGVESWFIPNLQSKKKKNEKQQGLFKTIQCAGNLIQTHTHTLMSVASVVL